jgi:hypothetical protein
VEDRTLLSTFMVKNTADSGPGSLRQAILDSNAAAGPTNTIDFDIPGQGVQTIAPTSPLPPITQPSLIDGTSQPGYTGSPLVALSGDMTSGSDPLTIASNVVVQALGIGGFAIGEGGVRSALTLQSVPFPRSSSAPDAATDSYKLEAVTGEQLTVQVLAEGVTTRLKLRDTQGNVLIQSDRQSVTNADNVIGIFVPSGTYSLLVQALGGMGTYTLTTRSASATSPAKPFPVGLYPYGMVKGDFNADGRTDIATTNVSGTVSVLLGNGDGTFAPAVTYPVGRLPEGIVTGDFNGDGRVDLAVANLGDNSVSLLLGNGDGTFQPQVVCPVGVGAGQLVSGDFNSDGVDDLAVANGIDRYLGPNPDNTVSVLLGRRDGSFQPQVVYPVGVNPWSIVSGDFNGDGSLDLATANVNDGTISVLRGNGDGTFQPQVSFAADALSLASGDFNGDGKIDLAAVSTEVSVLLGNGDGTFQSPVTYAAGKYPRTIVLGDFNRDGKVDLGVNGDDGVSLLLGNGDGTFLPAVRSAGGTQGASMVSSDFNGDGKVDLAVFNGNGVSLLLGYGDGTFQPQIVAGTTVGSYPTSIVSGDFNGDGRLDLVTTNGYDNSLSVLLGNGAGSWLSPVSVLASALPWGIASGDFNGDGRLDLAVGTDGSNAISILLGNGDGRFQPPVMYPVGSFPTSIVSGDFNGDRKLDLAVANSGDSTVSLLLGNGDGTFQPQRTYAVGGDPFSVTAGDFNGDGRLDVAAANSYKQDGSGPEKTVSVLLGNGDGTFQPQVTHQVGAYPGYITSGDLNGDGIPDLITANSNDNTVSVLLGNGDGTFQPQVTYAVGSSPLALIVNDFNGDGHLDLATANAGDNTISVLLNHGDGTFQSQVPYTVGYGPGWIASGDFNGDGKLDLATANGGDNTVSTLLGNGDGTFSASDKYTTTPHVAPLVADVNGDGTEDVLVLDGAGEILYRQAIPGKPGSFEPPVTINPGFPSRDITWVAQTDIGPLLASVDARDNAVSFYAWRDTGFVRIGSLTTGQLPSQVIAADLDGNGLTDIVVRNARDGTLSVYFGTEFNRSGFVGPINPQFLPPRFLPSATLPVGLGVSDMQAIDTAGTGVVDLVVTSRISGLVSILRNRGGGSLTAPEPYRGGAGLYAVDTSDRFPVVTSLESTAGVAAGAFTPGGPIDLVVLNPGLNEIGLLAGQGQGRFADPVTFRTQEPVQVVRVADFNHDDIPDLAVLSADALHVYLGDGKGGFLAPTTYTVPSEADGLTVSDLLGNGKLDLLVGDAYGDVLVLLGNGDGTFEPYHEANQAVALAVADLTGNGSKDVIYADQGLDRVVVDYGAGGTTVLASQSTGLLDPGAVKLADLNGDGIPDLIVANSGSNNVLIYPGLGNGQFGPAINGGHGYFVGTNPVGITVANLTGALPDLVVADKGSNQVSILLNTSQQGGDISFNPGPRLNSGGTGPVSTVVGFFTPGSPNRDILVTNSVTNNVALLPGVGGGFFNDTKPQKSAVGTDPGPIFTGNFDGKPDLITVNAGSNDLTLISDFMAADAVTETISSGGTDPVAAFSFSSSSGFDNLIVGNGGDGVLALFEGSEQGLSLSSSETNPDLPSPSALVYAGLTGGQVQFYGATEGREAAALVALSLGGEIAPALAAVAPVTPAVAQVVPLQESSLALVGTFLITTLPSANTEVNLEPAENEVATTVTVSAATPASFGQSVPLQQRGDDGGGSGDEPPAQSQEAKAAAEVPAAPSWQGHVLGTDEAIDRFDREHPNLSQPSRHEQPQPEKAQESGHSTSADRLEAIERALEGFFGVGVGFTRQVFNDMRTKPVGFTHPATKDKLQCDYAAALALAATVAGEFYFGSTHYTSRSLRRFPGLRGRWNTTAKNGKHIRSPQPDSLPSVIVLG